MTTVKDRILASISFSAWLGLFFGSLTAVRAIASHHFVDLGLFRMAILQAEIAANQAFQEVSLFFFPVLLLQQILVGPLRMRPSLSLAIVLPLLAWSIALAKGCLQGLWPPYFVSDPDPLFFPSLLLALAMAVLATFWPPASSNARPPTSRGARWFSQSGFVLLGSLLLLNLGTALDGKLNTPNGPNVLFIVVDTMRADHMGTYDYPLETTPYLDGLAEDSIIFKNAISVAPWTTPSIGAMFTSRFPTELEWQGKPQPLGNETALVSELFRNHNYNTTAFVSHFYISASMGFRQGFDLYDDSQALGHRHISSESISKKAVSFLDQQGDRPFFLFLHYFDPHSDYFQHDPYDFFPDYSGDIVSGQAYGDLRELTPTMSEEDLRFVRALYDSEIRFTDAHIQRVLEHLKKLDLYENTLIVFTTDHGEEFSERGDFFIGHGTHLYQELIHVPLFIKLPEAHEKRIVSDPVSTIDLAPTLAHYAGLGSLSELPFRGTPILVRGDRVEEASAVISENGNQRSLVDAGWKLIVDVREKTQELYDLSKDPRESRNLAAREPEILLKLLHRIREHEAEIGPDRIREISTLPDFSAEQIEQLKAMGYIE